MASRPEPVPPDAVMPADLASAQLLWQAYKNKTVPDGRAQLFLHYSSWCRQLATHYFLANRHPLAEWRDYLHFASMGMLQALDSFEPNSTGRFEDYAKHRVKGAIFDGLHCYISDSQQSQREHERLHGLLDENKNMDALTTVASAAIGLAFGYFLELGILDNDQHAVDPLQLYRQHHDIERLQQYVERLPVKEKTVIVGHYFQQLDFVEIATLLELSKPRINQLHHSALHHLREFFEAVDGAASDW